MLDYTKQEQWGNGFGQQQSPVPLNTATAQAAVANHLLVWQNDIEGVSLSDKEINFQMNGHGHAVLEQRPYQFQQLHFHAPAEHVIDDDQAAMEWHFVFQDAAGQLAVVARVAHIGAPDPVFEQLLTQFKPHETVTLKQLLDVHAELPATGPVLRYLGSLTTPPLTEGVRWYVAQTPLSVSKDQLARYHQLFEHPNNRHLQALNGRPVLRTKLN